MFNLTEEVDDAIFRANLDKITQENINENVGMQVQLIAELSSKYNHSISLVAEAIPEQRDTFQYTCFQYAFDLVQPPPEIIRIARAYPTIYPNSQFVEYLILNRLSEISAEEVVEGDVVVYLSEMDEIKHAGKAQTGLVVSKWGLMHLWQHRIFEVPGSYGSTVRFFRAITRMDSIHAFLNYAKELLGLVRLKELL